ncbi:MAG: hypothetical protein JW864_18055 [Spirochaetes bacterium]|nr:hypothetical protein [Spirochaetota bacterium]
MKINIFNRKLLVSALCIYAVSFVSGCSIFTSESNDKVISYTDPSVLGVATAINNGIKLDIRNPYGRMKYNDGYLYVSGASQLMGGGSDNNDPIVTWGGVQRINTETFEKDDVIYPYHSISDVAVVSSTQAYLVEYLTWGNSVIKRFNPTTGEVEDGYVAELGDDSNTTYGDANIISIETDKYGKLWVCCYVEKGESYFKGILVIDTADDTIEEEVDTVLVPQYLQFCDEKAVAVTATMTYSAGAHSVIPIEQTSGVRMPVNNLTADTSDLAIDVFGNYFYRIQRYYSDSVMKFHIDNPGEVRPNVNTPDPDVIWQYAAMDDYDEEDECLASTNPHALAVYSETRGFLTRYESRYAWVVNPSATSQSEFKEGKLDLSIYGDDDGIPEMSSAIIIGDRVFIGMQRLYRDSDGIWKASKDSYVAVFNADTLEEIDASDPAE